MLLLTQCLAVVLALCAFVAFLEASYRLWLACRPGWLALWSFKA